MDQASPGTTENHKNTSVLTPMFLNPYFLQGTMHLWGESLLGSSKTKKLVIFHVCVCIVFPCKKQGNMSKHTNTRTQNAQAVPSIDVIFVRR